MSASPRDGDVHVSVLRWPEDAPTRELLAKFRQPRLLLVEPDARPPAHIDDLEDWMRAPADPVDLRARTRELYRRSRDTPPSMPVLDDQGLLWVGWTWVDLTPAQAPVVRLLLENLDRVVGYDAIVAAYAGGGSSGHPASVRTLLARIRVRVRPVALDLVTVRQRGVLLTQHLSA